jgi:hypothetical protein
MCVGVHSVWVITLCCIIAIMAMNTRHIAYETSCKGRTCASATAAAVAVAAAL